MAAIVYASMCVYLQVNMGVAGTPNPQSNIIFSALYDNQKIHLKFLQLMWW